MNQERRPLTESEVRRIVGPCEDESVVAILKTGARSEQILEAFERVSGNTAISEDLEKPMDPVVARLVDILAEDAVFPNEEA